MIVIVDYGRGNLFSLGQAFLHLGIEYRISGEPAQIAAATHLIIPGVGAFGDAMGELQSRDLVEPIQQAIKNGIPCLGICVGCQLLMSEGTEFGRHDGLNIIPGSVKKLPKPDFSQPNPCRIPNVGWRQLNFATTHPILSSLTEEDYLYFVHSFAPRPISVEHTVATCSINGEEIPVAVAVGSVLGVQFHPEKSGNRGLQFLTRFAEASSASFQRSPKI
jgi:imidazole glycerol-phosphate synthase subunit HisH